MPVSDQGATLERYMLIPRVLIFLRRGDDFLLLKGAHDKRLWANLYNGVGGHVEPGEDLLTAARRELFEETGLRADLRLAGTLLVDTERNPGIAVFIFTGEYQGGKWKESGEGSLRWVNLAEVKELPVVEDILFLLDRLERLKQGDAPFSARSFYDDQDRLMVAFID